MDKKGKLFRTSKPYGYYMPDVDNAIKEYNTVISLLKQSVIDHDTKRKQVEDENMRLKEELKSIHIQLSTMEIPDMSEETEYMLLDDFSNNMGKKIPVSNLIDASDFGEVEKEIPLKNEKLLQEIDDLIIVQNEPRKKKKLITSFDDLEIVE